MEIETKANLDSDWDDIYTYLKNGDWGEASQFCESHMRHSYNSESFLTAVKCVRFWKNSYEEAEHLPDQYCRAQKLIDSWGIFTGHYADQFSRFERGIHTIRHKVFSDALFRLLQARHEDSSRAMEENFFLLIGRCYKFLGDFPKSIDILKKAYQIDRHNSAVLAELADCCSLQGESVKSKIFFSEAFYYDPSQINLNFIETIYIKRLADLLTNEYNIKKDELVEWIPVYATAFKIFNVRRELLSNELRDLKQRIRVLEDEEPEGTVLPRLLYAYCRLIFHLYATPHPESTHYEIGILLNKIKTLNVSVYNELIK